MRQIVRQLMKWFGQLDTAGSAGQGVGVYCYDQHQDDHHSSHSSQKDNQILSLMAPFFTRRFEHCSDQLEDHVHFGSYYLLVRLIDMVRLH